MQRGISIYCHTLLSPLHRWRWHRYLFQRGRPAIHISLYCTMCSFTQRWRWRPRLFQGSGLGISSSLLVYSTCFCCAEVELLIYSTCFCCAEVEGASSPLSRSARHFHLATQYYVILYTLLQRWKWHPRHFKNMGIGLPSRYMVLHYTQLIYTIFLL